MDGIEKTFLSDETIDVASISMAREQGTPPSLTKKLKKALLLTFFLLLAVLVWFFWSVWSILFGLTKLRIGGGGEDEGEEKRRWVVLSALVLVMGILGYSFLA